jgi:AAA-like domain
MVIEYQNPYYDLAAVRDPIMMFFGRVHELRRILSAIANKQSISLVGSLHMGKSSTLHCVCLPEIQQRFELDLSHHLLVLIDLRDYFQKTSHDFFTTVSDQIIAQNRGRVMLVRSAERGEGEFSSLLDQIKEQRFHLVLLMDAFDNVTRNKQFSPEFFSFLRAKATQGKVSYVTASLASLDKVCHQGIEDSPFFNIFSICNLEPLLPEEAKALITKPAEQAGLPFTQAEVAWILARAGRHPFYLQRLCHYVFEEKSFYPSQEIDRQRVTKQAYHDLLPHFEATWIRLPEPQQELLKDEAQSPGTHRREQLPELSESALFRRFVRRTCQLRLFEMTQAALENILDDIDNTRALGDSDLKQLKLVSQHMKKGAFPSTVERGFAVREVLNEALERMRATTTRSDSAPDWKLYNILYYRYFRHHLKHEQIAARLGYSTRQYYRARKTAIETLLNMIIEMETIANRDDDE